MVFIEHNKTIYMGNYMINSLDNLFNVKIMMQGSTCVQKCIIQITITHSQSLSQMEFKPHLSTMDFFRV